MMKRMFVMLSVSVAYIAPTSDASAMDLQEALVHTYQTNPTLLAERETLKSIDETYNQGLAGFMPTANLNGDINRHSVERTGRPKDSSTGNSRDLTVTQPVFNGGGTIAQVHQTKNQIMAGRATLKRAEQSVLLNAISAYMDVIRNEEILKLSQKNLETLRKNQESARTRFNLQEVTRTDVAQANARVSQAVSEYQRALGDVDIARSRFKNRTGLNPVMLTMPEQAKNIPSTAEETIKIATKNNPDVQIAAYTWDAAKNTISVSKAALLPSVSLRGQIRETDGQINLGGNDYDTKTAAVNASLPIYQSGAEYSRIRQNKSTAERRRIEAEDAPDEAILVTVRAWEGFQVARATLKSSQDAASAASTALLGVTEEAEVGTRTVIDVLDAQRELFTAQIAIARANRDEIVGSYTVQAAIGELTAEGLQLPVDVYKPEVHFDKVKYKVIGY